MLQDETRVELYIDGPEAQENKALFDALIGQKKSLEDEFGVTLSWQRLDGKRASRISYTVLGGWVDEYAWSTAVDGTVRAMQGLYNALSNRVVAFREGGAESALLQSEN
ncbi:MAG: DUF4268 domain-containing protein [bacterium]|nr:DUF4268 domain-containing protein [Planctomycetota bacterium]HIL51641.1 DUF4268 domain-containing protein [Planctomycetota bacterium]